MIPLALFLIGVLLLTAAQRVRRASVRRERQRATRERLHIVCRRNEAVLAETQMALAQAVADVLQRRNRGAH